jgi:hypothetical protein
MSFTHSSPRFTSTATTFSPSIGNTPLYWLFGFYPVWATVLSNSVKPVWTLPSEFASSHPEFS